MLTYFFNMGHVNNAVNLWLGMRPADIFVFVFLPPFLLDLAVRIDFFMLKKVRHLRRHKHTHSSSSMGPQCAAPPCLPSCPPRTHTHSLSMCAVGAHMAF